MSKSNDLLLRQLATPPRGVSRSSFWDCLLPLILSLSASVSGTALPPILANQNHASAGELRDGILTVQLEIAGGDWHPEANDGVALSVYAFGESGKPLQNPGPLIRVPQGTEIRASLHNTLSIAITVHGLGERKSDSEAVLHIAPGAVEQVTFTATTPGLYLYWAAAEVDDLRLRNGIDAELTGAMVVDPLGTSTKDEIFVLEMISDIPGAGARQTLATINLFRPAVEVRKVLQIETKLTGEYDLVAERRNRFASEFLIGQRTIDFSGVEEGDAAFEGCSDYRDPLLFVRSRT
jgi:hypothetical protein